MTAPTLFEFPRSGPPVADLSGRLRTVGAVLDFLFAGNAILTVRSLKTGTRFTYKVKAKKAAPGKPPALYFVSVLTGPENGSNYRYLGVIYEATKRFKFTLGSHIRPSAPSALGWVWFYDRLLKNHLPETVEVWHEGRCGRCARRLTVPESVERGLGPECAGKGY